MIKNFFLTLLFVLSVHANAMIDLELTEGVAASIPLAIPAFSGVDPTAPGNQTLTQIIENDLQNSGEFRVIDASLARNDKPQWKALGADYLLLGSVLQLGGKQYKVHFSLRNLVGNKGEVVQDTILEGDFTAGALSLRQLGHRISDEIYAKLTGVQGVFNTKIAYVLVQHLPHGQTRYQLQVADQDGFNTQTLLRSESPIMSPAWSPNSAKLAYVSFEGHRSAIYLQSIKTGHRELLSQAPGINGAPTFAPFGDKMAFVLSKTGNPKIYTLDLKTHKLEQITFGWSIDTEPAFSVDGRSLIFTSNRDGSPQIYQYFFSDKSLVRLTYSGNYNARASFVPSGQSIVLMHRDNGEFGIARMDTVSGQVQTLVSSGFDESPSLAPNGRMIIYATQYSGRGVLAQVSIDGRIKLRLPAQEGLIQEPAWSPYRK